MRTLRLSAPRAITTAWASAALRKGWLARTYQTAINANPAGTASRAAQPAGVGRKRPSDRAGGAVTSASSTGRSTVLVIASRLLAEQPGRPDDEHEYQGEEDGDAVGARQRARLHVELGEGLHDPDEDAAHERAGHRCHPAEHGTGERRDEHAGRAVASRERRRDRGQERAGQPAQRAGRTPR